MSGSVVGGVKVSLDVGFERMEENFDIQGVDLTNGQQHIVNVKRSNKGRVITIRVSGQFVSVADGD